MDLPELRLRLTLWLHCAWPFRVLSWLRERGVPPAVGFGAFRRERTVPIADVVAMLRADIAALDAAADTQGNLVLGQSGHLAVTTPAAARALMLQDVADGHLEQPDIAIDLFATGVLSRLEVGDVVNKSGLNVFPKLDLARAYIADAERLENSLSTRVDAAINAVFALDPSVAKQNPDIGMYADIRYQRPLRNIELTFYYDNALLIAKTLLSKLENIDDEHS